MALIVSDLTNKGRSPDLSIETRTGAQPAAAGAAEITGATDRPFGRCGATITLCSLKSRGDDILPRGKGRIGQDTEQ
jgi:hypothetical protein